MKYFIVSDIHSFYSPLKAALANVGYDKDNPEHTLIVCGDLFDRGEESRQLLFFIMFDIPRERRILIRGNHEYDFVKLVKGEYVADKWDRDSQIGCYRSNGTIRTMCSLARIPEEYTRHLYWLSQYKDNDKDAWENYDNARHQALQYFEDARNNEMVKIVAEWIQSDDWIDFYELDNLILTHSFIPTIPQYTYYSTWRECVKHGALWEEATWVCPYIAYAKGGFDPEFKNGKTLVCGH